MSQNNRDILSGERFASERDAGATDPRVAPSTSAAADVFNIEDMDLLFIPGVPSPSLGAPVASEGLFLEPGELTSLEVRPPRGREMCASVASVMSGAETDSMCSEVSAAGRSSASTRKRPAHDKGSSDDSSRGKVKSAIRRDGDETDDREPYHRYSKSSRAALPKPAELTAEYYCIGIPELQKSVEEQMTVVEGITVRCKNIKGSDIRSLREAALRGKAGIEVAARLLEEQGSSQKRAITALRREAEILQREAADERIAHKKREEELIRIINQLREERDNCPAPRTPPPPPKEDATLEAVRALIAPLQEKVALLQKNQSGEKKDTSSAEKSVPQPGTPVDVPWSKVVGRKGKKKAQESQPASQKGRSSIINSNAKNNAQMKNISNAPANGVPTPLAKPGGDIKGTAGKPDTNSRVGGLSKAGPKATCTPADAKQGASTPGGPLKNARKHRIPNTAAVSITIGAGAAVSYADVMRKAREGLNLQELGVEGVKMAVARNGGRLLRIAGAEKAAKARALAEKMSVLLAGTGARVACPVRTGELRVRDLDDSVSPDDVIGELARVGDCPKADIRCGDIRRSGSGVGSIWAKCPLAAATKIAAAGKIRVGWSIARVELLEQRATQCFRCLGIGHVAAKCGSEVDRSALCFRCGEAGHRANTCAKAPKCHSCAAAGRPANHRAGGDKCAPPPSARSLRKKKSLAEKKKRMIAEGSNQAPVQEPRRKSGDEEAPEEAMQIETA